MLIRMWVQAQCQAIAATIIGPASYAVNSHPVLDICLYSSTLPTARARAMFGKVEEKPRW